jgi:hypothetical protein
MQQEQEQSDHKSRSSCARGKHGVGTPILRSGGGARGSPHPNGYNVDVHGKITTKSPRLQLTLSHNYSDKTVVKNCNFVGGRAAIPMRQGTAEIGSVKQGNNLS